MMPTAPAPCLLVLGASTYQVPFIRAALSLGVRTITLDNRPENPGHSIAHLAIHCDTTDVSSVVALARRHQATGVLAAATDVALDAASAVGVELELRAPTPTATKTLTRKLEFRKLQRKLGLPHPEVVSTYLEGFPYIVKPNRASGSKGVRIVSNAHELESALADARSLSVDGTAFAETLLRGIHGTLEGVMAGGSLFQAMVTERLTAPPPLVATIGHRTPAALTPKEHSSLVAQIETVCREVGYGDGPIDCDFILTARGPVLIELTPRAGGNALSKLLQVSAGFDMPLYAVRHALGLETFVAPFMRKPAITRVLSLPRGGILRYEPERALELAKLPWIHSIELDFPTGAKVPPFRDGRDRFGDITITASSPQELDDRLSRALIALGLGEVA